MNIPDGNKLITEFYGYRLASCNNGLAWEAPSDFTSSDLLSIHGRLFYPPEHEFYSRGNEYLQFNTSWEWLMPLVQKLCTEFTDLDESEEMNTLLDSLCSFCKMTIWLCCIDVIQLINKSS